MMRIYNLNNPLNPRLKNIIMLQRLLGQPLRLANINISIRNCHSWRANCDSYGHNPEDYSSATEKD